MITILKFDGKKEVGAFISDSGKHSLLVSENPNAVIGEPTQGFEFSDPILVLEFESAASVESVIKRLETVRDAFLPNS